MLRFPHVAGAQLVLPDPLVVVAAAAAAADSSKEANTTESSLKLIEGWRSSWEHMNRTVSWLCAQLYGEMKRKLDDGICQSIFKLRNAKYLTAPASSVPIFFF